MAKVTISEAVGLTGISESTIRRDIKSGKVSSEKDEKGHRRIDIAELQRVYDLTPPPDRDKGEPESQQIIGLLENQIADLRSQLEKTETQLQIATTEKSKLLDLLSAEKDEKRALMPPLEEKNQESKGWLLRLIGAR